MAVGRRVFLLGLLAPAGGRAQRGEPANAEPLRALHGLAELQDRAARLAAARDSRPEVKAYAAAMAAWRDGQWRRLRELLAERGVRNPGMLEDQLTVWQGLEDLDYLALSRRYMEVQVEALELEIAGYERAASASDPAMAAFAREVLPELRRRLDGARRVHDQVRP